MIISRYLCREVSKPLLPILAVLAAVFAIYNIADFLSDAANGLMPIATIAWLVLLKVLISLEVLIPTALYVSVFLSITRLQSASEHVAMSALHVAPGKLLGAVLTVAACLSLIVAALSLELRPWAYHELHRLSMEAANEVDLNAMQAGSFYVGQHGTRVIFLAERSGVQSPAQGVFVKLWRGDHFQIIHASSAYLMHQSTRTEGSRVYLNDAHVYDIYGNSNRGDQVVDAQGMILTQPDRSKGVAEYSSVAASNTHLLHSGAPDDIAELQWRSSTPLSTLLLGLLGLSMTRPIFRRAKYANPAAAILIYLGYQLMFTSARIWVQHDVVGKFPGVWWVPALLGVFLLASFCGSKRNPEFTYGRA